MKKPYVAPVLVKAGSLSKVTPAPVLQPRKQDQSIERKTHD